MKLKVKHGKWGYALIPFPIIALLGYVYVLVEPLQEKFANAAISPNGWYLALASVLLGIFAACTSFLSNCLLSVYKEASDDTDVELDWKNLLKGKSLFPWMLGWIISFGLISVVWFFEL